MNIRSTKIYKFARRRYTDALRRYHRSFRNKKFDKPTIVFESFAGKFINDSPWEIYKQIKKRQPTWDLIWSINKDQIPKAKKLGLKYVQRRRPRWAKLFAMADARVVNTRLLGWFINPQFTYFFQTWHGTPLKHLALDMEKVKMPGTTRARYKGNFLRETEKWDALISANSYSTEIFKRAFDFKNTVLEIGYPRNDRLITDNNPGTIKEIKKRLNLPLDKKIILYAPTFRDDQNEGKGKYKFELPFNISKLERQFGKDIFLITRMHYLISDKLDFAGNAKFISDFSKYDDINDLFLVSDVLITDYSSVMFDYSLLKRPMIFYPYDFDQFVDSRDYYFEYSKMPGDIDTNQSELISSIQKNIKNGFKPSKKLDEFSKQFSNRNNGHSAELAANDIIKNTKILIRGHKQFLEDPNKYKEKHPRIIN
jgi:CDP-glycerol glycerophosphotransferase